MADVDRVLMAAQERYELANASYDQIKEQFRLGEVDKETYYEAFENKQQAYADLQEIRTEHQSFRIISDD